VRSQLVCCFLVAAPLLAVAAQLRDFPPDVFANRRRDIIALAPSDFSLEFQNDRVRAVKAKIGPGSITPSHDAGSGMLVALTEVHLRFTRLATGRSYDVLQAGESRWLAADTYTLRNLSGQRAEYVFVELREETRGSGAQAGRL
jgi:hypothetical protein